MTNMKNKPKNKAVLLKRQWALHMILWAGLVYLLIFAYIPMVGIIIAFKEYKLSSGVMGFFTSRWVGLKWFKEFFASPLSGMYIRNTIVLSALKLLVCFPVPILFALMLNEVRSGKFKKLVQTASYLPHFISWVILAGIIMTLLDPDNGLITQLIYNLTGENVMVLTSTKWFVPMLIVTDIYKGMGWGTILYFAAITCRFSFGSPAV